MVEKLKTEGNLITEEKLNAHAKCEKLEAKF
jgi:hypothetical protein